MNKSLLVDSIEGCHQLSHVESRDIFREDFILDEHGHQITTRQEFHQHIKVT